MPLTSQQIKDTHNRALRLMGTQQWAEAEPLLSSVAQEQPFDHLVHYNLGILFWETGRRTEAARSWRKALACQPNFVPAMVNLSNSLDVDGDRREALRYIQMAARRLPDDPRILVNLASILMKLAEGPDAWQAIQHAHQIAPDDFAVANVRMAVAVDLKLLHEVEGTCLEVLRLHRPGCDSLVYSHLTTHYAKLSQWEKIGPLQERMREVVLSGSTIGLLPMSLCFSFDDAGLTAILARKVGQEAAFMLTSRQRPQPRDGKPTIGYMSPDLRNHPVAHMLLPVLQCHDRSRFRILTIGTLPMDDSDLSRGILAAADGHLDLSRLDDTQAADRIREAGVDILVDLAGSTQWHRPALLGKRPAQTQVMWMGCPSTTGLPFYDAFLVDDVAMTQEYAAACSEPLYRLGCCYHPISQGQGQPNPGLSRIQVGLPESLFVLGLLQFPAKIRPPFTDDLIEILRRLPLACLWLRSEASAVEGIGRYFQEHGIDPKRIICATSLANRSDYLAYFGLPDLLIDSFPYGGHSTTGEALALGHPVVTRAGTCLHTRVAASMLHELGMPDLVTYSREEYIDLIVRLANDSAARAAVKARARDAAAKHAAGGMSRLARELETAYLRLRETNPAAPTA
jgi:protein O-GlcNAc transferase